MATSTDLWGDLMIEGVDLPVNLLKNQAALLAAKTKNRVVAHVASESVRNRFVHRFVLRVPGPDDYEYELFRVSHETGGYPVWIDDDFPTLAPDELRDRDQFLKWLADTLSSEETKKIVATLASHGG